MVTSRMDRKPDRVGYPLHLLDADASVAKSFGVANPVYRRGLDEFLGRVLAPAPGGRFYAGHRQEYIIEKWDTLGRKVREIVRPASWFRPWITEPFIGPDAPKPQPRMQSLHEDDQGRLWVFTQVTQSDWKKFLSQGSKKDGEREGQWRIGGVTRNTGFDTMIEVIDLRTNRLLVSQRVDEMLWKMFEGGLAYSDGEDAQLESYVDIWRLKLIQPR